MAAAETHSDAYHRLQMFLNPDGSLTRRMSIPSSEPTPTYDPNDPTPVLSKDINIDTDAWFRLYLPRQSLLELDGAKLPVVFYFHGGGFVICSPANTIFHRFCSDMAAFLPAVVVSFSYPLAPEHRLPAAYHHATRALHWIKTHSPHVDWLRDHADLDSCFLMGSSAGGNLAYHVALRAAADLKIKGVILHHPFFGGAQRTPTELRLADDAALPRCVSDLMWELALPVGADRDHEYCNPTVGGLGIGWKVLVTGFEGDPLYDRQVAVARMMEGKGVDVETVFKEGGQHGLEVTHASEALPLHILVKKFVTTLTL